MANIKKENNVNQENNNDDILVLLKSMQEDILKIKEDNNKLKQENEQLVKQIENTKNNEITNIIKTEEKVNSRQKLDPNMEVVIINMFDGLEFNLKINDLGAIKTLNKFGQKIWVTLKEARDIVRLNDKFAKLGYFIFEDRTVVEDLLLDDDYEKIVDVKTLNKLPDLDDKTLEGIYINANIRYKEMIINKFVDEYIKGQDIRFRDRRKIDLLSDLSNQDIMLKITETEKANHMK